MSIYIRQSAVCVHLSSSCVLPLVMNALRAVMSDSLSNDSYEPVLFNESVKKITERLKCV